MPFLKRAANVSRVADTPVIGGEQQVSFVRYTASSATKIRGTETREWGVGSKKAFSQESFN
jgi:hypothetical protein